VLIIGSGPGASRYSEALESFIREAEPLVIALNLQSPIEQSLIDYRAACHPVKLLADCENHLAMPQPLIVPVSMLPERVKNTFNNKKLLDFGLSVKENTFEFHTNYTVLPRSFVIAYVLGIVTRGKAKQILLAGFDGFTPGDSRTVEMDNLFSLYFDHPEFLPVKAITPTLYKLPQTSIYDPELVRQFRSS